MSSDEPAPPTRRRVPVTVVAVAVLVVVIVVAVLLASGRKTNSTRGAQTAKAAATLFVGSVSSGSAAGATAISCTAFADQARSLARSGLDKGITFRLGTVTQGGSAGTAELKETIDVGGTMQAMTYQLTLAETGGRWLVCGRG